MKYQKPGDNTPSVEVPRRQPLATHHEWWAQCRILKLKHSNPISVHTSHIISHRQYNSPHPAFARHHFLSPLPPPLEFFVFSVVRKSSLARNSVGFTRQQSEITKRNFLRLPAKNPFVISQSCLDFKVIYFIFY